MTVFRLLVVVSGVLLMDPAFSHGQETRSRARELGIHVGILPVGEWNAITDVEGVEVGHKTIVRDDSVRTGVTIVRPHGGNVFQQKVPAAVYLANAFGKLAGSTQIQELGNLETPIALTNTLSVGTAVEALVNYTLELPENESVRSVNAVVGETNDGFLNDIRGMHVTQKDVLDAIRSCTAGKVAEGSIGAGTGTVCFGFKGGIGTSSRIIPESLGGYTVGVLVQTNFGGVLTINGAPIGRELGKFAFRQLTEQGDGSCMIVVATDAPLDARNLERLTKRAVAGMARTGAVMSNGSGDFVIAFSTAYKISHQLSEATPTPEFVPNDRMTPLFLAVAEATEEAIYNSLLGSETMSGRDGNQVEAIPVDQVVEISKRYNLLNLQDRLPSIPAKRK